MPTPHEAIVAAKFVVVACVGAVSRRWSSGLGLVVGAAVVLPGWSPALIWQSVRVEASRGLVTLALMSPVALFASVGRGYCRRSAGRS